MRGQTQLLLFYASFSWAANGKGAAADLVQYGAVIGDLHVSASADCPLSVRCPSNINLFPLAICTANAPDGSLLVNQIPCPVQ